MALVIFCLCACLGWYLMSKGWVVITSSLPHFSRLCVFVCECMTPLVSLFPYLFLPVFQTRGRIYFSALQRSLCQGMLHVSADLRTINTLFSSWSELLYYTQSSVLKWRKYKPTTVWKQQVFLSQGQPGKMASGLCRAANELLFETLLITTSSHKSDV